MVKPRHPVRPPTKTVMSRQWKVLDRAMATRIISNWPKTHQRARPTRRTLWDTSVNWRKCMRSQRESLTNSHYRRCFSPALTGSNFQSWTMSRPTRRKATNTMAPCRQSTSSHLHRTHPWKTPRLHQLRLRHARASRPAAPTFKRDRETSQTSA